MKSHYFSFYFRPQPRQSFSQEHAFVLGSASYLVKRVSRALWTVQSTGPDPLPQTPRMADVSADSSLHFLLQSEPA